MCLYVPAAVWLLLLSPCLFQLIWNAELLLVLPLCGIGTFHCYTIVSNTGSLQPACYFFFPACNFHKVGNPNHTQQQAKYTCVRDVKRDSSETILCRMRTFSLTSALLLCSLCWISVSASESHTVDVEAGDEVTLLCSNGIFKYSTYRFWSRFVNRTMIRCIASIYSYNSNPRYCNEYQNGNFEITYNSSDVYLKIKQVDLSDSGLYLCGFIINGDMVIDIKHLNVQENLDAITKLTSVTLGGLTVFLLMLIIGLVVKIRKLQTAQYQEHSPQTQDLDSDDLNYAALRFLPNPNLRPASERELETNVVYAATR
ncbi:uncharacterized protein LOC104924041 isoform X2 [Larimichthys crocea]|uniref:uncharacterized protein LOC104924041 isoform X2 n=1 Tax=Larimichthys crocea TaxID=215358 RepID=UPI000F5FDDAE|nr:uncharacterized protein LOC104924041 isoform X2 [Larimichthys crocea]